MRHDIPERTRRVHDGDPRIAGETFVVRCDPSQELRVLQPDRVSARGDPRGGEIRGNTQQDREIGQEEPRFARPPEERDRIGDDPFQAGALVCVRGIRVTVTEDNLALGKVGADLREMCGAVRKEQE